MKTPLIFCVVIYVNYVNSYILNGHDKAPKLISASFNKPESDYSLAPKVNRKRYTGFVQKPYMREDSDLLNSYFKIGSYSDLTVQSPDALDNASPQLTSIQPTPSARKEKKAQLEYGDRSQRMSFELQTPRGNVPIEKTEAIKNLEMEPSKILKRPIIVVGRVRKGAGGWPARTHEELRQRRKMGIHF